MRPRFGFFRLLGLLVLLGVVGVLAYNLGWSNGVATHLPAGSTVQPYYYGGPFGFGLGFGLFGFLWFVLIVFGVFWLLRLAFWGFGRRAFGGGWDGGQRGGPSDWRAAREQRMQVWHRRAHGEAPPAPSAPSGPGGTPSPASPAA
jgi:phosphotransferase system  glucose/maltose/N-acetylglucosamine-specific IIC component